jgi:phage-related protein
MEWTVEILEEAERFLGELPVNQEAKAYRIISNIEKNGIEFAGNYSKNISAKLWELKIDQVRLFYFLHRNVFVAVSGYLKKSPKTPKSEIEKAQKIMKKYQEGGG